MGKKDFILENCIQIRNFTISDCNLSFKFYILNGIGRNAAVKRGEIS